MTLGLFDALPFIPIQQPETLRWGSLGHFKELMPLAAVPISDTELLHLGHYAPIGVLIAEGGVTQPVVVLLTHPELAERGPFNAAAKWMPPYMPLALRALPFTPGVEGECLYSPTLVVTHEAPAWQVESPAGKPTQEFRAALDLVQKLHRGARRLSDAARLLLAADVLVPLEPIESRPGDRFLVVSLERLAALSPSQSAGLTAMGMLPLELAAASLFSRRYLTRGLAPEAAAAERRDRANRIGATTAIDPLPIDPMGSSFVLDTSPLFNIDELLPHEPPAR